MGLEKGLRDRIPEIIAVEQVYEDGPELSEEGVEEVLNGIRPFLTVTGGTIELVSLVEGFQPTVVLKLTGQGAAIKSIRGEIVMRVRKKYPMLANVVFDD